MSGTGKKTSFFAKVRAVIRAFFDKRTPAAAKIAGIIALIYLVFPLDVVSDFIPITGWADDAVITAVATLIISRLISKDAIDEHKGGEK